MEKAQEIRDFWINEVGPEGWYKEDEALDQMIRDRFLPDWELAAARRYDSWKADPYKSLALLILVDQFPRNMFRGDKRAFSTDKMARRVARKALESGYDLRTPEPQRQFYYMPLMHSECLTDQERCVRLIKTRMPESGDSNLVHAKVHREVIRKFGRFPYRNDVLSRSFTAAETRFMQGNGYQITMDNILAA